MESTLFQDYHLRFSIGRGSLCGMRVGRTTAGVEFGNVPIVRTVLAPLIITFMLTLVYSILVMCGKWETYPREFAKCRRCRKAKYCGKECQSTAWSEGHRFWCSAKDIDDESSSHHNNHGHHHHNTENVATTLRSATSIQVSNDGT